MQIGAIIVIFLPRVALKRTVLVARPPYRRFALNGFASANKKTVKGGWGGGGSCNCAYVHCNVCVCVVRLCVQD